MRPFPKCNSARLSSRGAGSSHVRPSFRRYWLRLEALEERQLLSNVTPLNYLFEFGTARTPAPAGAIRIVATPYTVARGYGWQGKGGIVATDAGARSDPVTRHVNLGRNKTFLVNLANGVYDVSPTLGDARMAEDRVAVWINGTQLASGLSIPKGESYQPTYRVLVSDGQLKLRLADQGGKTPYFAIATLNIRASTRSQVATETTDPGQAGTPQSFNPTSAVTTSQMLSSNLARRWGRWRGSQPEASLRRSRPEHLHATASDTTVA